MQTGLAEQRQLTIIEGRVDDAPHALVIDDGEKYAVAIDPVRLQAVFAADNGLAPIIDAIELKAQETSPDVRTVKGRADIRALAHKVTRSKTYLDGLGKDIVAELKELPKRIDANRKILRDRLDILAEETRQSLTDYEARIDGHKSRMQTIRDTPMIYREQDAEDITRVLNYPHDGRVLGRVSTGRHRRPKASPRRFGRDVHHQAQGRSRGRGIGAAPERSG
jgi:hypothetical protein